MSLAAFHEGNPGFRREWCRRRGVAGVAHEGLTSDVKARGLLRCSARSSISDPLARREPMRCWAPTRRGLSSRFRVVEGGELPPVWTDGGARPADRDGARIVDSGCPDERHPATPRSGTIVADGPSSARRQVRVSPSRNASRIGHHDRNPVRLWGVAAHIGCRSNLIGPLERGRRRARGPIRIFLGMW